MVCVQAIFISRSSPRARLTLRARLAFASVRLNKQKNYACSFCFRVDLNNDKNGSLKRS